MSGPIVWHCLTVARKFALRGSVKYADEFARKARRMAITWEATSRMRLCPVDVVEVVEVTARRIMEQARERT